MENKTKLNLSLLAELYSKRTDRQKSECEDFARYFFETITKTLQNDELVKIKGFGTFKKIQISARESVDVNTGKRILIDAYTKIQFVPEQSVKDLINAPFASFSNVVIDDKANADALSSKFSVEQESDQDRAEAEEEAKAESEVTAAETKAEQQTEAAAQQPSTEPETETQAVQTKNAPETIETAQQEQAAEAVAEPDADVPQQKENDKQKEACGKKKCKAAWIALIVLLVLLLVAAVYYVLILYNVVEPLDLSVIGIDFPKSE